MEKIDILRSELIGLEAKVIKSKNKMAENIKGKITDETRNMIHIDGKNLIKEQVILQIKKGNNIYEVDGKLLVGRPEDRLKRLRRI